MHTTPHPLAGRTVKLANGTDFRIEDWNDRVFGRSWADMKGHPASLAYAGRAAAAKLPLDNEVVYGKDSDSMGHLVHVSELSGD